MSRKRPVTTGQKEFTRYPPGTWVRSRPFPWPLGRSTSPHQRRVAAATSTPIAWDALPWPRRRSPPCCPPGAACFSIIGAIAFKPLRLSRRRPRGETDAAIGCIDRHRFRSRRPRARPRARAARSAPEAAGRRLHRSPSGFRVRREGPGNRRRRRARGARRRNDSDECRAAVVSAGSVYPAPGYAAAAAAGPAPPSEPHAQPNGTAY